LTSSLQRLDQQGVKTYRDLSHSSQSWGVAAERAATQALALITRQSLADQQSAAAHRLAEQSKSASTLMALKQLSVIKAVEQTAAGFADLGSFNFWGAAQHFASAALYGTIAGTQIAAAAGAGGRDSRKISDHYPHSLGSERGTGLGTSVSALSAGAAGAAHGPSGNLTVAIMGEPEAGEWLASTLNTAVEQRGVQLTSTRSTRSPYAQG
ncbi:MAG: hypothetical protein ACRD4Q_09910, partial [Candidatus Acidiferrales bacterium]